METSEDLFKRMWREARVPAPEPPPKMVPSTLGKPGAKVRVSSIDPKWNYAVCGHPQTYSQGTISRKSLAPEGKTAVTFSKGVRAIRGDGVADPYPYRGSHTLFLPNECLTLL